MTNAHSPGSVSAGEDVSFPGYAVVERVAAGADTITYRARHRGTGRLVLVTRLKPGLLATSDAAASLRRRGEALIELSNPLLTTVVDRIDERDCLAIVTLDGGGVRLDEVLARAGKLDASFAMAIGVEVARALAAIHRARGVHRDLRPAHVELSPDGMVTLHGYGGARPGDKEREGLSRAEDLSPEQIIGEDADARTDVFLAGALLFRMMAGRHPFAGDDAGGTAQRVRLEAPSPLLRHAPTASASVERIIGRCLEKSRDARYADGADLAAALVQALRASTPRTTEQLIREGLWRAGLAERPADARDRPTAMHGSRVPAWARRLTAPAVIGALTLLMVIVVWQALRPPQSRGDAGARGIEQRPARLRVLAHPWAEVHVDGELVEVTPVARAIEVSPGRHTVVFRHPSAQDQTRNVEVIAGQTVLLDVNMLIERPDAGGPAIPAEDESP